MGHIECFWYNIGKGSSVVECLTQDRGVVGSSNTGMTALFPWERHTKPCFVMVHPRKTCLNITEKLFDWEVKNQIKHKQHRKYYTSILFHLDLHYNIDNTCVIIIFARFLYWALVDQQRNRDQHSDAMIGLTLFLMSHSISDKICCFSWWLLPKLHKRFCLA